MNILVLGGTGFLGSHLAEQMAALHAVRVYAPSALRFKFNANIEAIAGLIADTGELKKQVEWADLIFHFVSTTNPKTSLNDHQHDLSSNLLPVVQLLDMMRLFRNKKIIFCSSGGAVYGHSHGKLLSEKDEKKPSTSYGLVKSTIEEYIEYYHRSFGIEYLILRPANVYGLKTRSVGEQGIISTLIYNAIFNKPSAFWVDLNNIRDYIFIDDFIEAVATLVEQSACGIYNIGSGCGNSLSQIIEAVQYNCDTELQITTAGTLIKDEAFNVLDISKIKSGTGWSPKTGIDEGISYVYDQMRLFLLTNENTFVHA